MGAGVSEKKKIRIDQSLSRGSEEQWREWFDCPKCGDLSPDGCGDNARIASSFKFCPYCGSEIEWAENVGPNWKSHCEQCGNSYAAGCTCQPQTTNKP